MFQQELIVKKIMMHSSIGARETLNRANVPEIHHNPNVGRHLTTHAANMVIFKINPNDKPLPDNNPFTLYSGGAFLPNPTPGSNPNHRGVQVFGKKN